MIIIIFLLVFIAIDLSIPKTGDGIGSMYVSRKPWSKRKIDTIGIISLVFVGIYLGAILIITLIIIINN